MAACLAISQRGHGPSGWWVMVVRGPLKWAWYLSGMCASFIGQHEVESAEDGCGLSVPLVAGLPETPSMTLFADRRGVVSPVGAGGLRARRVMSRHRDIVEPLAP